MDEMNAYSGQDLIRKLITTYTSNGDFGCLDPHLLITPVYVEVSILPGCPPGFVLNDQSGCTCFSVLKNNLFNCYIKNKKGYFECNSTVWIRTEKKGIINSQYCPLDYCLSGEKTINLATNPDAQCASNHAGILCGGCKIHYSLAVGSSRCIKCSNNKYTSLLIFFLGAGIMLVILSFHSI